MSPHILFFSVFFCIFATACSNSQVHWPQQGDQDTFSDGENTEVDPGGDSDWPEAEFELFERSDSDPDRFDISGETDSRADHDFSLGDGDIDYDIDYESYDCRPTAPRRALYWVNPFPSFGHSNPVGTYSGRLIVQSPSLPVFWPGMIIPADGANYFGTARYATFPIEIRDTLFLGNSSGGFWQANAIDEWQTVMEMTGGGPLSIAYDTDEERVMGFGICTLFVMERDGRHRLVHFNDKFVSSNHKYSISNCKYDNIFTKTYGEIILYKGQVYLYNQANSYTESDTGFPSIDKAWNVLFRLEGDDFTTVCEFPEKTDADAFPNYSISNPIVYEDLLILPGVSGEIWAYDGNSCFKWREDMRFTDEIINSQVLDGALYLSSNSVVYKYDGSKFVKEFSPADETSIWTRYELNLMVANPAYGQLFIGGKRYGDRMAQNILYVRERNGKWKTLHGDLWEGRQGKAMPALLTGAFASNGKGFILGNSTIANIEREAEPMMTAPVYYNGSNFSLWGSTPIDAIDAFTADGTTLYVLSKTAVKIASNPGEYVTLFTPSIEGGRFNRFVETPDGLVIIGESGLICMPQGENAWTCEKSSPTRDWFEGVWYDQALWVSSSYDLFRINDGSLEYIPYPERPADFDRGNHEFLCGPHPYPERCTFVFQPNHLTVSDGQLFFGRNDGVWVRQNDGWARVAPPVADTYVTRFHTVDLTPCGDGVCRISTNSLFDGTSRLDVITKQSDGSYTYNTRPLDYGTMEFMPMAAVRQSDSRTLIMGRQGMIVEWADAPSNPRATAIEYCPSYPSNDFDLDAFYGSCTSSFEQEIPDCRDGECRIPVGDYCVGASREMDENRLAKASDLPILNVPLNGYYIDELPVSTQAYAEFLDRFPYENQFDYLTIDQPEPGLGIQWNGEQMVVVKPEQPMLFANIQGAKLYCEQAGKRLCTAAEWEAACRGHDDDPFPGGWTHWHDLSPQPSMDGFIPPESDFGVMDMVHYGEFTVDPFYHDSLRMPPPSDLEPNSPLLKGFYSDGTCSTRRGYVNPPSSTSVTFRCCRDSK